MRYPKFASCLANQKAAPTGPFGIVPYNEWIHDVTALHMMGNESPPTNLGGFWYSMYANNCSPLMACQWNYDFSPCVFMNPEFSDFMRTHRYFRFTMNISPRHGIGEIHPIEGFEP